MSNQRGKMIKKCKVCKEEFEVYDVPHSPRRHKLGIKGSTSYKRPHNSKTCSHKCSVDNADNEKEIYAQKLKDERKRKSNHSHGKTKEM